MKPIAIQPSLADQVYEAIVDEICGGALPSGAHLVQEQLAERLGVSRQPVQQAMALLKADGLVQEIGRRGLQVAALDLDLMDHHYTIRAALDGLAARLAAERSRADTGAAKAIAARGDEILRRGSLAVAAGEIAEQVRQDVALHTYFYECSGNPLLPRTAEPHWRFLRRAMGDVMRYGELPAEIWRQHEAILQAVIGGDPARAETLAVGHVALAAKTLRDAMERRREEDGKDR